MLRASLILATVACAIPAAGPAPATGVDPADARQPVWSSPVDGAADRRAEVVFRRDRRVGPPGARIYFVPEPAAAEARATVTVVRGMDRPAQEDPTGPWAPAAFERALSEPCGPGAAPAGTGY